MNTEKYLGSASIVKMLKPFVLPFSFFYA